MLNSEIVIRLMFDWLLYEEQELTELASELPLKTLRWLGENHPDNKTRKIFFRLSNISIPDSTVLNKNFVVSDDYLGLLRIGERVAIAPNVTVVCTSAPNNSKLKDSNWIRKNLVIENKVIIEDDAWIGSNVTILPGVIIGNGSIIGAGSIVTKDTKSHSITVGNPAVKLKDIPEI